MLLSQQILADADAPSCSKHEPSIAGNGHELPRVLQRWGEVIPRIVREKLENNPWEFQDPKMEVLYHVRPYSVRILPYIALT